MGRKKKEVAFYVLTVFCCILAITVIIVAALLIYDKVKKDKDRGYLDATQAAALLDEASYSEAEVSLMLAEAVKSAEDTTKQHVTEEIRDQIEQSLLAGNSVIATLRPLYPDDIVIVSNSKFYFIPIRDDVKHHSLVEDNLKLLDNGELQYVVDDQVVSHKGIDVSKYQGKIDWQKVAAEGVEYAIIRLGVRGYGVDGNILMDDMFLSNVEGATKAGIKVGVYFFSQAITDEEAVEEADIVLETIKGLKITYPIVYDVEKTGAKDGRMNQLSVEDRTRITRVFIDKIKDAGYTPMIYSNMEMWTVLLDMASFEDIEKWFAYYSPDLYFPYDYAIWQYSDTGHIDGIEGNVDLNISFKEW